MNTTAPTRLLRPPRRRANLITLTPLRPTEIARAESGWCTTSDAGGGPTRAELGDMRSSIATNAQKPVRWRIAGPRGIPTSYVGGCASTTRRRDQGHCGLPAPCWYPAGQRQLPAGAECVPRGAASAKTRAAPSNDASAQLVFCPLWEVVSDSAESVAFAWPGPLRQGTVACETDRGSRAAGIQDAPPSSWANGDEQSGLPGRVDTGAATDHRRSERTGGATCRSESMPPSNTGYI